MKVAISAEGTDENSKVCEVSGRSPHYIIFDKGKKIKVLNNPFRFGGGGAGFSLAAMLEDEKIDVVISGRFGPNMITALESKGIKHKEMHNITVKEALKKIR